MIGRKKMEDTQQVAFRLSMDLIRRADAYGEALSAEHPGMHYTRTDAVRIILAKHLPPSRRRPMNMPNPALLQSPERQGRAPDGRVIAAAKS